MSGIAFTWDDTKARNNSKKHGVTFDEAKTAFLDDYARLIADPGHSENEDRFILLGMSSSLRILVVCHCYRESENIIRLISAGKANKSETKQYRDFRNEK